MISPKKKTLAATLIILCNIISVPIAANKKLLPEEVGGVIFVVVMGAAFAFVSRVRCPSCNKKLSDTHPLGGLLLLWLANDSCKNCGKALL